MGVFRRVLKSVGTRWLSCSQCWRCLGARLIKDLGGPRGSVFLVAYSRLATNPNDSYAHIVTGVFLVGVLEGLKAIDEGRAANRAVLLRKPCG